jgi:hypothetical protein
MWHLTQENTQQVGSKILDLAGKKISRLNFHQIFDEKSSNQVQPGPSVASVETDQQKALDCPGGTLPMEKSRNYM